jgi:cytochrome c553
MKLPNKRKVLLSLLAILVFIQIFRIDKTNPPIDPSKDILSIRSADAQTTALLKSACYDCHSHESQYPWYTNVQPVAWWIKGHIKGARQHLNFSEWASYDQKKQNHKLEECIEEVKERHMPMKSYTWAHSKARLSDADIQTLVAWFEAQ